MFDHDAPFDEAGLGVLADCVVGFEDVILAVHEDTGHFTNLDRLVKRIEQQDAALERRLAEEPPQMTVTQDVAAAPPPPAEPPPPAAPPPLSLDSLLPGRGAGVVSERDVHGVLPKMPVTTGIEGRPPYLAPAEQPAQPPAAESAGPELEAAESATRAEDYDPEVAAIFSEEATELLEAADGALTALRSERGGRERVTELKRVLHTLKGGARMAGITAMGDLSHELESLVIQLGEGADRLDDRSLEVAQASLDEIARMRDYVSSGRPVAPARDLVTRIRLVARGGAPARETPAAQAAALPAAPAAPATPAAALPAPPPVEAPAAAAPPPPSAPPPEPVEEAEERAATQAPSGPPVRDAAAERGE